jgi:para-nitrobenzyl esterase
VLYQVDADPERGFLAAFRDARFTWPMRHWAELASAAGQNVYLYFFTFEPPGPMQAQLRAYHAAEIRYAFGNGHLGANGGTAEEHALADVMSDYWSTFAATGTPISAKGATWPRFTADAAQYLELAATPKAGRNLSPAEMALMDKATRALWNVESLPSN